MLAFINTTSIVSDEVSTLAAYSDVKRYPNGLDAKCLDRPIQLYLEPSERVLVESLCKIDCGCGSFLDGYHWSSVSSATP